MCDKQNCCEDKRVTAFQIGPDPEKDIVPVENLLMKLAMAESVIANMERYIAAVEENGGICPENLEEPDAWATAGMTHNLHEVGHALRCGCWGYQTAHLH